LIFSPDYHIIIAVIFMTELRHPYIAVDVRGHASYGGGQQFSENAMVQRCGCGIIAATDLLLYLSRWHPYGAADYFAGMLYDPLIPFPAYSSCILRISRRYFPMIPYAGINGIMLMTGMQRFFREHGMPYSARWCFASSRLWERISDMLQEDIPVVMSVGPNFPVIWGDKRVRFYCKTAGGVYTPGPAAKSHYFTVTGMDEEWLRISSWGRLYYLKRNEFIEYMRRYSLGFTSNILLIERK